MLNPEEKFAALEFGKSKTMQTSSADLCHVQQLLFRSRGLDRASILAFHRIIASGSIEEAAATINSSEGPIQGAASCSICGEAIEGAEVVSCSKGHHYHAACTVDWLFGGHSCPCCREPLFVPQVSSIISAVGNPVAKPFCVGDKVVLRQAYKKPSPYNHYNASQRLGDVGVIISVSTSSETETLQQVVTVSFGASSQFKVEAGDCLRADEFNRDSATTLKALRAELAMVFLSYPAPTF